MIYYAEPVIFVIVNGKLQIITNKTLLVPYSSNVELNCDGPGDLSWQYMPDNLGDAMNSVTKKFPLMIKKDGRSVLSIDEFDRSHRGFYTCLSSELDHRQRETILLNSGKFTIVDLMNKAVCLVCFRMTV